MFFLFNQICPQLFSWAWHSGLPSDGLFSLNRAPFSGVNRPVAVTWEAICREQQRDGKTDYQLFQCPTSLCSILDKLRHVDIVALDPLGCCASGIHIVPTGRPRFRRKRSCASTRRPLRRGRVAATAGKRKIKMGNTGRTMGATGRVDEAGGTAPYLFQ